MPRPKTKSKAEKQKLRAYTLRRCKCGTRFKVSTPMTANAEAGQCRRCFLEDVNDEIAQLRFYPI